jgi:hypothetical protein
MQRILGQARNDCAQVAVLAPQAATSAPVNRQTVTRTRVQRDPLADLLQVPVRDLTSPLPVASSVLGDTVFLVANDRQAATVRAKGGIPYTPEEIDILLELHQAVGPEVWGERLKLIHEAKRRFEGTIMPERT